MTLHPRKKTGRRRKAATKASTDPLAAAQAAVEHTISVVEAGKRYFNISKNSSYQAVAEGRIPVIRVGKLLRVPVRAMERMR